MTQTNKRKYVYSQAQDRLDLEEIRYNLRPEERASFERMYPKLLKGIFESRIDAPAQLHAAPAQLHAAPAQLHAAPAQLHAGTHQPDRKQKEPIRKKLSAKLFTSHSESKRNAELRSLTETHTIDQILCLWMNNNLEGITELSSRKIAEILGCTAGAVCDTETWKNKLMKMRKSSLQSNADNYPQHIEPDVDNIKL